MNNRSEALALARRYAYGPVTWDPAPMNRETWLALARALLDCEQERAELERQRDNAYHMPLGSKAREWESRAERAEARVAELEKALREIATYGDASSRQSGEKDIARVALSGRQETHAIDCDLDDDCTCS